MDLELATVTKMLFQLQPVQRIPKYWKNLDHDTDLDPDKNHDADPDWIFSGKIVRDNGNKFFSQKNAQIEPVINND
jgi:hypothetical protein